MLLPLAFCARAAAEERFDPTRMPDGSLMPTEAEEAKLEREVTVVPFVGGDSDVGLGGGFIASVAEVGAEYDPYRWRLEASGTLTVKGSESGTQIPYVDSYLLLVLPHVVKSRLRLEFRLSYTREATLKYYGLGDASRIPEDREPSDSYFEHVRIHPTLRWRAQYRLTPQLLLTWGLAYTQNWLDVPPDTLLGEQMRAGSAREQRLLGNSREHGVAETSVGLGWDSRDNEVDPERGQYHTLRADLAPGGAEAVPYRWARVNAAARVYVPLVRKRVTFAMRVMTDLLLGSPPFYELPRYDDTSAIGGVKGIRGVPAQRYYGKAKILTNSELRTKLFDFDFLGKQNTFGLTGFFDAGRLWADYRQDSELDGDAVGLKYGAGGGVRLSAGESFVLRLDVAWSPDANPLGGYLTGGHIF